MLILGIDPGPARSGWALFDTELDAVPDSGDDANEVALAHVRSGMRAYDVCAVERIRPYGMAVGAEVFESAEWGARFVEAADARRCARGVGGFRWIERREAKLYICGTHLAKDPNVRLALIDRWGGKDKAIGNKESPGPLYKVKGDAWSALAVAVTAWLKTSQGVLL